jgi:hypothetical protein
MKRLLQFFDLKSMGRERRAASHEVPAVEDDIIKYIVLINNHLWMAVAAAPGMAMRIVNSDSAVRGFLKLSPHGEFDPRSCWKE